MGNTAYYGKELLKIQFAFDTEHNTFSKDAASLASDIQAIMLGTLYELDLLDIALDLLGMPEQGDLDDEGAIIGYPHYINRDFFYDAWRRLRSVDKFMDFCEEELTKILGECNGPDM